MFLTPETHGSRSMPFPEHDDIEDHLCFLSYTSVSFNTPDHQVRSVEAWNCQMTSANLVLNSDCVEKAVLLFWCCLSLILDPYCQDKAVTNVPPAFFTNCRNGSLLRFMDTLGICICLPSHETEVPLCCFLYRLKVYSLPLHVVQ